MGVVFFNQLFETLFNFKKMKRISVLLFFVFGLCCFCNAQDMVYKPKNPAFGGDTFNYNWLLSSAQAQNLTKDTSLDDLSADDTLDDFSESLNRQLLNQLSRQLVTDQFGEAGLTEGSYTLGNFQVDITNSIEGLVVTILDIVAGEQTQVIIPHF